MEERNTHDAINAGINALSQYAFKHFPPPEDISIIIHDDKRNHVATLNLAFKISYGKGVVV